MRNRVHPGKENDGPCRGHMEGDVLVELYDAIQRCLSRQGYQRPADWEQYHRHIEM